MYRIKIVRRIIVAALLAFFMLGAGGTAQAALNSFATTTAVMPAGSGSPGVAIGGLPAWYQDINGLTVQPCLVPTTCGLIGLGDPMFNEALPMSYPNNFPSEAFYTNATAIFPVGPASALVVLAMEFTFIDAVTGNLITANPRPANALAAPFQRQRLVITYPAGVPPPTAGNFTITHPWGVTTFPFGAAKCVNNAGGIKCSMTQDLPAVGAIPPSFAGALGTGVVGSQSTFLRDPLAPAGFLGSAAATNAFTGAVPGSANSISVTDPLGNTGTTTSLTLLVGQLVGLTAAPAAVTFPAQRDAITSAPVTVTITNPDAVNPATLGVGAITGASAVDFALAANTCSGAVLPAAGTCTFQVTFSELAPGLSGTKTAVVSFPVTAPANMPPTIVNLSGVIDTIAPTVASTNPPNNGVNFPANNVITATFSEPVTGVTATSFSVATGGVPVVGTVALDAAKTTATLTPAANLTANVTYTGTITTAVTDIAGNPLATNVVFTFQTSPPDTTPPRVISSTPANNSVGARLSDSVAVTFNAGILPSSLDTTTFFLSEGVAGTVSFDPATRTASFKPTKLLEAFHTYTATVTTGVKSLGGVPMAADFTFTFFTNGSPTVPTLISPADGAVGTGTVVNLQWTKSTDEDGEPVTYHVWVCTNPGMIGCTPKDVSGTSTTPITVGAAFGGGTAAMLLVGLVGLRSGRTRRKMCLFLAFTAMLLMSTMITTSCGGGGGDAGPGVPVVSQAVTGLRTSTTYFWKVTADDGNGSQIDSVTHKFSTN